MKLSNIFTAVSLLFVSAQAHRVQRDAAGSGESPVDPFETAATLLSATGSKKLVLISDYALRFVQEEFIPMIDLIKSQQDELEPLVLAAKIFDVVENLGVRMAQGAADYQKQVFDSGDESFELTQEEILEGKENTEFVVKVGCGVKFAGESLNSILEIVDDMTKSEFFWTAAAREESENSNIIDIVGKVLLLSREAMTFFNEGTCWYAETDPEKQA